MVLNLFGPTVIPGQSDVRETSGAQANLQSDLDMNTNSILNVVDPATAQGAATKNYVDTKAVLLAGNSVKTGSLTMDDGAGDSPTIIQTNGSDHTATMVCQNTSGDWRVATSDGGIEFAPGDNTIDCGTSTISGVVDPTADQEVATKKYVDDQSNILRVSIPGCAFKATNEDDDIRYDASGAIITIGAGVVLYAPVQLPHGQTFSSAVVQGNVAATETWELILATISGAGPTQLATANVNTPDNTISGTVSNITNAYFFKTSALSANDIIHGATLTFT